MPDTDFAPEIHRLPVEPRSVGDAREAIVNTRERISATLDAIEARIEDTKAEIRRRADVLRPVRERIVADPWRALAIGAGAGLVLGLMTGGDDEADRQRRRRRRRQRPAQHRAEANRSTGEWRSEEERNGYPQGGWRDELRELPEKVREIPEKVREIPETVSDVAHEVRDYAEDRLARTRENVSTRERFVEHLLHALIGAVSDGLSQRFRRAATD